MTKRTCSVDGCSRVPHARGYCDAHYRQSRRGIDLHPIGEHQGPSLHDRLLANVQVTESCWIWTAQTSSNGYGRMSYGNKKSYAHRLAYEEFIGAIPSGMEVDHSCRNRLCINPDHLRPATRKQNMENHTGARRNSKSGVRGVFPAASGNAWCVQVTHNRTVYSGGTYRSVSEAEEAAIALRNSLHQRNDLDRAA